MKIRMYIDLYPGIDPAKWGLCAYSNPSAKNEGSRRIAFDVTIPDSLLFQIDGYAPEVSAVEALK
jgi:hypothetical protein